MGSQRIEQGGQDQEVEQRDCDDADDGKLDRGKPQAPIWIRPLPGVDALVKPPHLAALLELAGRYPELGMVLDHGAKPPIAGGDVSAWKRDVALLARETPMVCKLSGLVTEAEPAWTIDSLSRYVGHLLECFGPRRLLWGSDWPVVDLNGGYQRWFAATETLLGPLPDDEREDVLGGNAERFYRLD